VKKWVIALLVVAGWMGSSVAYASEAAVQKAFEARYPGVEVKSVAQTPMPGIFEIYANGIMLYVDEKVDYLIAEGRLVDARTRTDLTAERLRKLQAVAFDGLPLKDAFTMVRGNGKRQVAYFADPNCAFCKKFERELLNAKDVTIHVFLYPILSKDSVEKARSVWCSEDRAKAWTEWMLKNVVPMAASSCDTPIDRVVKFGRERGIGGTPTIIFADGTRVPGMIPAADLNKLLDATAK